MWTSFFVLSISSLIFFGLLAGLLNWLAYKRGKRVSVFRMLFAGVFLAAFLVFMPVHMATIETGIDGHILLALFNTIQTFALGTEFSVILDGIPFCPEELRSSFQVWAAALYVLAPIFTFGFVLSFFKNVSAYIRYLSMYFKKMYIFSELNEKSLALASDIKKNNRRAGIAFNDVFDDNEEHSFELMERAKGLGAICFKKDILAVSYGHHSMRDISFFVIGADKTENLNQAIGLIDSYKKRKNTHLYIFSTNIESELLLTAQEKGEVKVRRINEVQSLINRVLYERGEIIFESAIPAKDGLRNISAVVVGMGSHGTEMVKALTWFCQMDGYRIKITAFDKNPLAEEKFRALAPELMSDKYNGVFVEGEAQYTIKIKSDCDVESISFADEISKIQDATYVFVSLGNDDMNIRVAANLRMLFARIGVHPIIQAVVNNSQHRKALAGIKNYRGQEYDLEFIGDIESSFNEKVIINSELEEEALQRHLKWGKEEEFWAYEYNYRSSVAAAIHLRAKIKCGIPGADKANEERSEEERKIIEALEHKRWNAYMRAEGYVYSGSPDKASRNDLAKMHHDLVDFSSLSEEEKRKDSSVGSK